MNSLPLKPVSYLGPQLKALTFMQLSLAQQVALVTGASSGIGAAAAKALAAAGAAVVINYHSQAEPAEALARQINHEGGRAVAIGADVSKEKTSNGCLRKPSTPSVTWTSWWPIPVCRKTPPPST